MCIHNNLYQTICTNPSNLLKTHSAPSVTVSDMEAFFGPFAEIKILEENLMGPEAEQVQRFKVTPWSEPVENYLSAHSQVDKMTERIFFMVPKPW